MTVPLAENSESNPGIASGKVDSDEQHKADRDGSITETSLSGTISNDEATPVGDHLDAETSFNVEAMASNLNGDLKMEEVGDIAVRNLSNATKDVEAVNSDPPDDSNQNMISEDAGSFKSIELSESQSLHEDAPTKADSPSKDVDLITEPDIQNKPHQEQETVTSAAKVQEQLDEVNW